MSSFFHRSTIKHAFLGLITALAMAATAHAQSSVGHITGKAVAGDTVLVQRVDGGFNRELSIKKDGKYQIRSVSPGSYTVTVTHADGTIDAVKTVVVRIASTARVQ